LRLIRRQIDAEPCHRLAITAQDHKFDKDCLAVPAGQAFTIKFDNKDADRHNLAILPSHMATETFFQGDIVAGPGRESELGHPRGLLLAAMDGAARNLVEALIDRFVGTLAPDLATAQKQRVIEQELGRFRFAWAGTLSPGQAHYFRVHGPVTLIEHDNTQNNANHIHSVWRDLAADFGHDALADHYKRDPHR